MFHLLDDGKLLINTVNEKKDWHRIEVQKQIPKMYLRSLMGNEIFLHSYL